MLYNLINTEIIDGLIILSGSISRYIAYPLFKEFCSRFENIPSVSLSYEIENMPSVIIDNTPGLRTLMIHLIKVHRFHRFAFILGTEGNPDALIRFHTFTEVLKEFNLPLDKSLILPGDFTTEAGINAAQRLMKESKGLFDVIIASNDEMAIGAIKELKEWGIRVPEDVGVVGFDNLELGHYSTPALTTVRQPIYEQTKEALDLVINMIKGLRVPPKIELPTEMVIRHSCGCSRLPNDSALEDFPFLHNLNNEAEELKGILRKHASLVMDRLFADEVYNLLEEIALGFMDARKSGHTGPFLNPLNDFLSLEEWSGSEINNFKEIIKKIRTYYRTRIKEPKQLIVIGDLCLEAFDLIGQIALSREKLRDMNLIYESTAINRLREEVLNAPGRNQLMDIFAQRLPELDIQSCYISLFQKPRKTIPEKASLVLAFSDNKRIDTGKEGILFNTEELVPNRLLPLPRRFTMIVKALKDQGFVIFEMKSAKNNILSVVGDLISTNLEGILLFQELEKQKDVLNINLDKMKWSMIDFINTIAITLETRDPYTAGHQRQVSDLARTIATAMKLPRGKIESIRMAGLIHDLGKIYVPVQILNKPGKLKANEFALIKKHAQIGYDILKNVQFPWPLARIVHQHHEKFDGTGYPLGLKDEEILLEARILSVADVVEAIISDRPYRPALGIEKALEEIMNNRGAFYDPQVVDACIRVFFEQGYQFKSKKRTP